MMVLLQKNELQALAEKIIQSDETISANNYLYEFRCYLQKITERKLVMQ